MLSIVSRRGPSAPTPIFWDPIPTPVRFDPERSCVSSYLWWNSVLRGSAPLPPQRAGSHAAFPQFWDLLYMRAHSMRNNNQILHDDQTRCEESFCTRLTRNADSRSVCGRLSNLFVLVVFLGFVVSMIRRII